MMSDVAGHQRVFQMIIILEAPPIGDTGGLKVESEGRGLTTGMGHVLALDKRV
jgi:hypothetical protein